MNFESYLTLFSFLFFMGGCNSQNHSNLNNICNYKLDSLADLSATDTIEIHNNYGKHIYAKGSIQHEKIINMLSEYRLECGYTMKVGSLMIILKKQGKSYIIAGKNSSYPNNKYIEVPIKLLDEKYQNQFGDAAEIVFRNNKGQDFSNFK